MKAGHAKPWIYSHASDHDSQAAEDDEVGSSVERDADCLIAFDRAGPGAFVGGDFHGTQIHFQDHSFFAGTCNLYFLLIRQTSLR